MIGENYTVRRHVYDDAASLVVVALHTTLLLPDKGDSV